jgi:hypothetical protein
MFLNLRLHGPIYAGSGFVGHPAAVFVCCAAAFVCCSLESMSNQFPWWDKWDAADPDAFWEAALPQLQATTQQQQKQKQQLEKKQG